jgi:hypothetical protein
MIECGVLIARAPASRQSPRHSPPSVPWPNLPGRQTRPSHPGAARIWEGQGPRRERAERAQAGGSVSSRMQAARMQCPPSTRARPEQAGGGHQSDDLRRLTDVTVNGVLEEHFEYDQNGNRT